MRVVLLSLVLTAAAAAPASAATTIGSDLRGEPFSQGDVGQNTYAFTDGYTGWTSTEDGVVTRWRIKVGGRGGNVRLRILRSAGDGSYTGVASSEVVSVPAEAVTTVAARIPIRSGDLIALDDLDRVVAYDSNGNGTLTQFSPAFEDGQTKRGSLMDRKLAMLVNADVEPDRDGDGFGDETQDVVPTAPARTIVVHGGRPQRVLRHRHVVVFVRSPTDGTVEVGVTINLMAGRTLQLPAVKRRIAAARTTPVRLRVGPRRRRLLRQALARHRRLDATAFVTVVDDAGVQTHGSASFFLRR